MEEEHRFASGYAAQLPGGCETRALTSASGVFLVNSDSAILLALFRQIASDFDQLNSASWIITAYLLGLISAQPLVCSVFAHLERSLWIQAHGLL